MSRHTHSQVTWARDDVSLTVHKLDRRSSYRGDQQLIFANLQLARGKPIWSLIRRSYEFLWCTDYVVLILCLASNEPRLAACGRSSSRTRKTPPEGPGSKNVTFSVDDSPWHVDLAALTSLSTADECRLGSGNVCPPWEPLSARRLSTIMVATSSCADFHILSGSSPLAR